MNHPSPHWKSITSLSDLHKVIDQSRFKPALVLKHRSTAPESIEKKIELETTWNLSADVVDVFIVDDIKDHEVSLAVSEVAGIQHEFPQIVLFADGVTMYDESQDMINAKKIKLALKIVNRTFRWMETRA